MEWGRPPSLTAAVYVCLCYGITERAIREAAQAGARSLPELSAMTGCGGNCGSCLEVAEQILQQARGMPLPLPVLASAA